MCSQIHGKNWKIAKSEIKEIYTCIYNKTENSNFAIHWNEKNHKFIRDSGVKLIHHVENSLKLNIYEAFEIIKSFKSNPDFCLNDQINISNSPILNLFPSITEKTITHRHYWKTLTLKPFTYRHATYLSFIVSSMREETSTNFSVWYNPFKPWWVPTCIWFLVLIKFIIHKCFIILIYTTFNLICIKYQTVFWIAYFWIFLCFKTEDECITFETSFQ